MREVVLDTETTGLDPAVGHRIVEIGCVELMNHLPTGESLQLYINPEREMPHEAFEVHGLSDDFLSDKPKFHEIIETFQDFIADSRLVIHNAGFDLKFLNAELAALDLPPLAADRAVDTVRLARQKYPGAPCLARAEVYLELVGGRQPDLTLDRNVEAAPTTRDQTTARQRRGQALSGGRMTTKEEFIAAEIPTPIWKRD